CSWLPTLSERKPRAKFNSRSNTLLRPRFQGARLSPRRQKSSRRSSTDRATAAPSAKEWFPLVCAVGCHYRWRRTMDRADLRSAEASPSPDGESHRRGESARGRVSAAILGPPRRVLQPGVIEKFALHLGGDARHQARTKQGLDPKLLPPSDRTPHVAGGS